MTAATVTRRAVSVAVLLATATLLTAGCGDGSGKPPGEARSTSAVRDPATRSPSGQATSGTFNSTDIGWIQLMIAMDDQTTVLLGLVPGHSSDTGVEKWAKPVAIAYRDELVQLRKLLARAGVPDTNPHQGHDMPGMVTEDELRTIKGTKGAAFDTLFLAAMRDHLDQAAKIAHSQRSAGADPAAKRLAASVEKTSLTWRARLPKGSGGR
ncbi:DUF305 domain-containing protein [Streptomyces sp. 11-1-2]|uniref:DUF305 domain-containing protein n=1 Tax=unclassified Streptomyces TaxID=2593676 RepID=UPI000B8D8F0B|nr:DUF305 domain-containing protein [Streptomyces sp. 11-1-2]ASQ92956.1 hypothetical protein CGL27_07105 [Streptomyces sp. 11-1-2]